MPDLKLPPIPWEKLEGLEKSYKLAIIAGTYVLVAGIIIYFLIYPTWNSIALVDSQITNAKSALYAMAKKSYTMEMAGLKADQRKAAVIKEELINNPTETELEAQLKNVTLKRLEQEHILSSERLAEVQADYGKFKAKLNLVEQAESKSEEKTYEQALIAIIGIRMKTEAKRAESRLAELEVAMRDSSTFLPDKEQVDRLLKDVSARAMESGLHVLEFKPSGSGTSGLTGDFLAKVPFNMIVEGPFLKVASFLYKVSELPRVVHIDSVKMSKPIMIDGDLILTTAISGKTFRFVEGQIAEEGGTGKAE